MTLESKLALGKRIRDLREEQGLTQTKLALMVDLNRTHLLGIEHGRCNPGLGSLEKIAGGFGITLSELLEGVDASERIPLESSIRPWR